VRRSNSRRGTAGRLAIGRPDGHKVLRSDEPLTCELAAMDGLTNQQQHSVKPGVAMEWMAHGWD